jgi:hypothetical protein
MLLRYPLVALVRATRWAAIEGAPGLTRGLVEIGEALRIEALGSRQDRSRFESGPVTLDRYS